MRAGYGRPGDHGDGGPDSKPLGDGTLDSDGSRPAVEWFSDITGTGPRAADGVEASTITVILRNADELPVVGVVPTFAASGPGNTLSQNCTPTDAKGVSTCTEALRSTVVQDVVLSITSPVTRSGGLVRFDTVQVFRSVGPGNTTPLATGAGNALKLVGSVATFSLPLPPRAGVGDAVQYDADGDGAVDAIAFLHQRLSSTSFSVRDHGGLAASKTHLPTTTWALLRAYTSLAAAESGTENAGIDGKLRDFDGGNDLTASRRIWNLACYADAPDTAALRIRNWISDAEHYLRIFTPVGPTEVGVSQRHAGVWDSTRFRMEVVLAGDYASVISALIDHVRIEGLQILATGAGIIETHGIAIPWGVGQTEIEIHDNIVRGQFTVDGGGGAAILVADDTATSRVWNNIAYDWAFGTRSRQGIHCRGAGLVYHNTVAGCRWGFMMGDSTMVLRNNLALGNEHDYYGATHASSSHNAGIGSVPGTAPILLSSSIATDYVFGPADLRLNPGAKLATQVIDAGTDLTHDPQLPVAVDIVGTVRPQGAAVDPGAFEAP